MHRFRQPESTCPPLLSPILSAAEGRERGLFQVSNPLDFCTSQTYPIKLYYVLSESVPDHRGLQSRRAKNVPYRYRRRRNSAVACSSRGKKESPIQLQTLIIGFVSRDRAAETTLCRRSERDTVYSGRNARFVEVEAGKRGQS